MLGLIYRLVIGTFATCNHDWQCKDELEVECSFSGKNRIYVMRCKKCGDMKNHKITD
jgi:transcription elongation factor Elf1